MCMPDFIRISCVATIRHSIGKKIRPISPFASNLFSNLIFTICTCPVWRCARHAACSSYWLAASDLRHAADRCIAQIAQHFTTSVNVQLELRLRDNRSRVWSVNISRQTMQRSTLSTDKGLMKTLTWGRYAGDTPTEMPDAESWRWPWWVSWIPQSAAGRE